MYNSRHAVFGNSFVSMSDIARLEHSDNGGHNTYAIVTAACSKRPKKKKIKKKIG